MLGGVRYPARKNVQFHESWGIFSSDFVLKLFFFKCSFCIEQYDIIMLMGFQDIFLMNKHEI